VGGPAGREVAVKGQEGTSGYLAVAGFLVVLALVCVALMAYGEWFDRRLVASGALGVLLVLYAAMVVLFRKAGWTAEE
jgi:Mg2+ and Co2+ transporter CorA